MKLNKILLIMPLFMWCSSTCADVLFSSDLDQAQFNPLENQPASPQSRLPEHFFACNGQYQKLAINTQLTTQSQSLTDTVSLTISSWFNESVADFSWQQPQFITDVTNTTVQLAAFSYTRLNKLITSFSPFDSSGSELYLEMSHFQYDNQDTVANVSAGIAVLQPFSRKDDLMALGMTRSSSTSTSPYSFSSANKTSVGVLYHWQLDNGVALIPDISYVVDPITQQQVNSTVISLSFSVDI
jgi:hypothetical protein